MEPTSIFLKALACSNKGRPPIWLMRQAGRYMPSYRALRSRFSFIDLCKTPELSAKVALLPLEELDVDAAILFSDILFVVEAAGADLHFDEQQGPLLSYEHAREEALPCLLQRLPQKLPLERLFFAKEAIALTKSRIEKPLIGFSGAPFTLLSYLIEGKTKKELPKTRRFMMRHPEVFKGLIDLFTSYVIDYLNMQVEAGVEAIQVFDSWAGILSPELFAEFCQPSLARICCAMRQAKVPLILFCRGTGSHLPALVRCQPAAISCDWTVELASALELLPKGVALQGNLDPTWLYAPLDRLRSKAASMCEQMKGCCGYIANLGHGVPPDAPYEAIAAFVDVVKSI